MKSAQDYYNYAPHIGVAYKLNDKTVARGNGGVFFTPLNMNTWGGVPYQQAGNVGFHNITQEGNFNWDNGYNPTLITPTLSEPRRRTTSRPMWSVSIRVRSRRATRWQYNIGVQRELDRATKVDVNWIQSWSTHLQSGIFQHNQPKFSDYQNYVVNGKLSVELQHDLAATWQLGDQARGRALRLIRRSMPVIRSAALGGSASGQRRLQELAVQRDAPRGKVDFLCRAATTGRARTATSTRTSQEPWGTGSLQNTYDLKDEAKDIADFDMTHIVKGYMIYNLPFGRGKHVAVQRQHAWWMRSSADGA